MPYYLCENFGKCELADAGERIELLPGAEPICPAPTCHEPLRPAGNSNRDPVFLALLGAPEREAGHPSAPEGGARRLLYSMGLVILLVAGLVGGVVYLLSSPAGFRNLAHPAHVAPSPAPTTVVAVKEERGLAAKPTPAQADLTPNRPVQAEVTPGAAVQPDAAPSPVKPAPTPARVADEASEDILTAPDLGDEAAPALRKALRNCDRVTLSFQFDRRDFVTLDRRSLQHLNRLVAFLRRPGMSKRHLVVVGCTDGTGTQLEDNFYARSRAVAFIDYLQKAGVKNPVDQLLRSSGDYLTLRRDSSAGEPQSNRRVDVYLKR